MNQQVNHRKRIRKYNEQYVFLKESILLSGNFVNDFDILSTKNKSGVYVISVLDKYFKIGSSNNIYKRLISIERNLPFEIQLIEIFETKQYRILEKHFHSLFQDKKIKSEWFLLNLFNDIDKMKEVYK